MALFGTDGIRGRYGEFLTLALAQRVAFAAGLELPVGSKIFIGRDTRASGVELEAAIAAGFQLSGHSALLLGVIPTPGLAYLTAEEPIALGVMITASHNPAKDNGIKIFSEAGVKIPDEMEARIEEWVNSAAEIFERAKGARIENKGGVVRYKKHLLQSINTSLAGITVVLDCAHGAASDIAPEVLANAGAKVISVGAQPDGKNINAGVGSTHLNYLRSEVLAHGADLGIAFDGDADRALMVDNKGRIIDGDVILAALALAMVKNKTLPGERIVTTVMSNLGFLKVLKNKRIAVEVTTVGDRYVLEKMIEKNLWLGGEQSGHIIIRRFATTGDGILTSLQILALIATKEQSATSLVDIFKPYPQVLLNFPTSNKDALLGKQEVLQEIDRATILLGEQGRILVRASGTEELIRIMVEADTIEVAQRTAQEMAQVLLANST